MNWFLRGLFQPTTNRHYVGKRLHLLGFGLTFVPTALFCIIAFVVTLNVLWLLWLTLVMVYGLAIYHTYDRARDKILWEKLYKRHYSSPDPPVGYEAMKAYEANPSSENKKKIQAALKEE